MTERELIDLTAAEAALEVDATADDEEEQGGLATAETTAVERAATHRARAIPRVAIVGFRASGDGARGGRCSGRGAAGGIRSHLDQIERERRVRGEGLWLVLKSNWLPKKFDFLCFFHFASSSLVFLSCFSRLRLRTMRCVLLRRSSKGTRGRRGGRGRRKTRPSPSSSPPHLPPPLHARPTSSWASRARPRSQRSRPRTAKWL